MPQSFIINGGMKGWTLLTTFTMGDVAAMAMLLGFLGLIGGILMRWSADTSAKAERSVIKSGDGRGAPSPRGG
jgi:hypothetical protein